MAKANLINCIVNGVALTQKQIDDRTSDYVLWWAISNRSAEGTARKLSCGLCGVEKSVTHIRHWNWLNS